MFFTLLAGTIDTIHDPRITILKIEKIAKDLKKVSLSPEDNLSNFFSHLNKMHDNLPNIKTGMIVCFQEFVQTVHPKDQDISLFNDAESREHIYNFYQKIATTGKQGRGVAYYKFDNAGTAVYLKVAFTELSNIIEGIPEQTGFCAVCKAISYAEYKREAKNTEDAKELKGSIVKKFKGLFGV